MKKTISVLLIAVTVLTCLCACGKNKGSADSAKETEVAVLTSGDFSYTVVSEEDKTCRITGYAPAEVTEKLELPEVLGEYKVVAVGKEAFAGNEKIVEVDFPKTLETIEEGAFKGSSIKRAIIAINNDTGTVIGAEAFAGCTQLTQADIPGTVKEIGAKAFSGCTALFSVGMKCNIDLPSDIFTGCDKLSDTHYFFTKKDNDKIIDFANENKIPVNFYE